MSRRPAARRRAFALALGLSLWPVPDRAGASPVSGRIGVVGMREPRAGSLLVGYHEAFLRDRDLDAFRMGVAGRYHESTLARLLQNGDVGSRRAAVVALGLFGSYPSNGAVAGALKDVDPIVRSLADKALWAIWFRADTPENNESLARISQLIGRGRLAEAIEQADRLIARSPDFAEAWNQRAIAHCYSGMLAESVADCREAVARNPYHTGAMSGMGQCLLRLGRRQEAIAALRRALEVQPFNESLRDFIAAIEAGND